MRGQYLAIENPENQTTDTFESTIYINHKDTASSHCDGAPRKITLQDSRRLRVKKNGTPIENPRIVERSPIKKKNASPTPAVERRTH